MKFKIGDKVRVMKFISQHEDDGYGEADWPEGMVGSVVGTDSDLHLPYVVEFEGVDPLRTANWFAESELEAAA